MEQAIIKSTAAAITDLMRLTIAGEAPLWIDYDKEADVLYVNFGRPQKADDSFQGSDGIIRRKRKNKLIGLTFLNASQISGKRKN